MCVGPGSQWPHRLQRACSIFTTARTCRPALGRIIGTCDAERLRYAADVRVNFGDGRLDTGTAYLDDRYGSGETGTARALDKWADYDGVSGVAAATTSRRAANLRRCRH